jgi:DNA polymerase-3 subunit gamma/tau
MSYQVLARKYRPQRFSDVVGQEHVTQTLANAIKKNRIAHAYLFAGPRGTGKTTIARIFAKCLNCTGGPKAEFDDNDPRCREIAEGRSLDVLEIDGASNRGIEEVRELRDTVKYAPATSKFKIYIIDEVHMLTKEAFNALLKTLEEPPAHVKFMFATTEPEKVLPTILSRCQRFDLRRIPAALIVKHLAQIAELEKVKVDEAALYAIARGAEGCMRDAESTLDQLISFCGEQIVEEDVLSMFGLSARSQILGLAESVLEGNVDTCLRQLDGLARNGKDLSRLVSDLLNHFRNLLIHQVSKGDASLLEISEAERASLGSQAALVNTETLTRIMEIFTRCESQLRDAASKKILIEVALLKAIQAREVVSIDTVLKQLNQLRGTDGGGQQPATAPKAASAREAGSTPIRPAPPKTKQSLVIAETSGPTETVTPMAAGASLDKLEELWSQVVAAVGQVSNFTRTYLLEAHPVSFERGSFVIGFDKMFADHLSLVDNAKTRALIETKLKELGHPDPRVKFIQADAPPGRVRPVQGESSQAASAKADRSGVNMPTKGLAEKPGGTRVDKDSFKDDPLIKQALEIFKGQIVEVRA